MANQRGNPQNLKHFKKGDDPRRNTAGGQRKLPELDKLLADVLGAPSDKGTTAAEEILLALYKKALKGDTRAAELLLNRGYGKPKDNEGNPTEMIIRVQRNS